MLTHLTGSHLYHKILEENVLSTPEGNNSAEISIPSWPELDDNTKNDCKTAEDSLKSLCKNFDDKLSVSTTDESHNSSKTVESSKGSCDIFDSSTNVLSKEAAEKPIDNQRPQTDPTPSSPQHSQERELQETLFYSKLAEAVIEAETNEVEAKSTNSVPSKITRSVTLPWTSSSTHLYKKIKRQYLFGRRNPRKSTR